MINEFTFKTRKNQLWCNHTIGCATCGSNRYTSAACYFCILSSFSDLSAQRSGREAISTGFFRGTLRAVSIAWLPTSSPPTLRWQQWSEIPGLCERPKTGVSFHFLKRTCKNRRIQHFQSWIFGVWEILEVHHSPIDNSPSCWGGDTAEITVNHTDLLLDVLLLEVSSGFWFQIYFGVLINLHCCVFPQKTNLALKQCPRKEDGLFFIQSFNHSSPVQCTMCMKMLTFLSQYQLIRFTTSKLPMINL